MLTKAHVRYLEGRLIEQAKTAGSARLMNSQSGGAKLPESDLERAAPLADRLSVNPIQVNVRSCLMANRHQLPIITPPTSLWKGAAYDHADGVVSRVGDIDVPPGVDGDGHGVVQEGRGGRFSVSGVPYRSGSGEVVDTIARAQHPDTVKIAFPEEKICENIIEF